MFEVVVCKDQIPIPYHRMKFGDDGLMTIDPLTLADIITHRFNDRVQPDIGLLVELYDIVRAYDCKSLPDISVAYCSVIFRYIVFKPPIGSVWEGVITHSSVLGVYIALSFFHDILVPFANLPDGSEYDDSGEVWTWSPKDDSEEPISFVFAKSETVRFRVCEVKFQPEDSDHVMSIIGSMDSRTSGLGIKSWWMAADE